MKKLCLIFSISLALIIGYASLTLATNKIMVGYDIHGKYQTSDSDWWDNSDNVTNDVDPGFSIAYEYTHQKRRVSFGFGIETQIERQFSDIKKDAEFSFTPIYGVIYVHFSGDKETMPFFVGRFGLNMHDGNDAYKNNLYGDGVNTELRDGLYGAIGFGVETAHNTFSLLYSVNTGERNCNANSDNDRDVNYSKYSLVFGQKF
jgi:hypothetical protein